MKAKIVCYIFSFLGILGVFGITAEDAPIWWYTLCICVTVLCILVVHEIDPQFFIEEDKNGKVIE